MARVEKDKKIFVAQLTPSFIRFIQSLTRKKHSQTVKRRIAPLFLAHFIAAGIEPLDIFYSCALDRTALKKTTSAEYGMPLAKVDHALHEGQQVTIFRLQIPVQPADFVVLAVGVVVSRLSMPDCVPRIQHGYALRKQKRCQQIPLLLGAQSLDVGIVGGALYSAIPAAIVIVAVAIAFAVGLVMFFVVTNQILQGEAVMAVTKLTLA